ncbi:hypothetical protein ACN27F_30180 [Solwaraspora sp. WMMB335]|uniref:hypothetical protein n=1 Tax=Solwaraspora sp. WMMB335 TaxID=3404118 RepID=UPI003B936E59
MRDSVIDASKIPPWWSVGLAAATVAVIITILVVRRQARRRRSAHPELVRRLAERTVAEVAPEQSQMFPALADVYLSDPRRVVSKRWFRSNKLGSGIPPVDDAMLIGIAIWLAEEVLSALIGRATDTMFDRFRQWLRRLFRRGRGQAETSSDATRSTRDVVFALRQVDAGQARQIVLDKLRQIDVDPDRAEQVADATVVALLTIPLPTDDPQEQQL